MAVGKRHGTSLSFGVGWLQDQLRSRFDIRGPIGEPTDVAPLVQVGMEARPSLPWEYANARWMPVLAGEAIAGGGAGTFSSVKVICEATATRVLVITGLQVDVAGGSVGLYLDGAAPNGTIGFGLRDQRVRSTAGSSFTPVLGASLLAQNVAVALPAVGTRVLTLDFPALTPVSLPVPWVLAPGTAIDVFSETANQLIRVAVEGLLVPLNDVT